MDLIFEQRQLKPYAEPISIDELKEGEGYFSVQYFDDEMCLPIVESLVFIGRNLEAEEEGRVYFQDLESHQAGIRYENSTAEDQALFYAQQEHHLNHIFRYENALNELMRCFLRRQKTGLR